MSEEKDDETEREIIQVRRIIPKKKAASATPKPDEELKAKANELKKRVFRMQIALGIALVFFVFLGLRAVGCFPNKSRERLSVPNGSSASSNVPQTAESNVFPGDFAPSSLSAETPGRVDANDPRRARDGFNDFSDFPNLTNQDRAATPAANAPKRFGVFDGIAYFRDATRLKNSEENEIFQNEKELIKNEDERTANPAAAPRSSTLQTRSEPSFNSSLSTNASNFARFAAANADRKPRDSGDFPENLRVVRIATWNLGAFDFAKLSDFNVGQKVAKTIQEFDLVALQGIRAKNFAVLDGLVYLIATNGGDYAYVASTPGRRDEILAFFFNANAVEVDRSTVSDVFDSRGRLATPSLVAAFQTANVDAKKRFTFQIINADLSNANPSQNGAAALADAFQTLQKTAGAQGVSEDDVLLVGDFGVAIQKIKELGAVPNLVAIHVDKTTDANGGSSVNILFDSIATTEYVERFGVVDLADYFDISADDASKIAPTRPVWADFSVYEGGDAHFSASPSESFGGTN